MINFIWLFPDTSGERRFDVARVRDAVRSLPWVQNWRDLPADDPGDLLFECELADEKQYAPLPVQFRREGQSLSIGADRQLGLRAALLLQQLYTDEIFAVSEESLPNMVSLKEVATIEELARSLGLTYGPES